MKSRKPMLAALSALALAATASAQAPADDGSANRVRAHVEFLADDLLEGRYTGERGYDIAATYVASQFRALGLQPGGENGSWFQQVPFREAKHAGTPTARVTVGGKAQRLEIGKDITIGPSLFEQDRKLDAELVFVGYGLSDSKLGFDDYRGLDVRGKIVVALNGAPKSVPTEIAAHLGATKDDVAAAKGAIGFIGLSKSPGMGSSGSAFRGNQHPETAWVGKDGVPGGGSAVRLSAAVSGAIADRLFHGAARSLAAVRKQAEAVNTRPRGFPLRARLAVESRSEWRAFKSPEVIGMLPGADPALKNQYVVLMGHLDHEGIKRDAKRGEDAIYNGALDNASGVATMLEAAHSFVHSGQPPRRSVLFIANTAEERGLLGADYYARHPTVPIDKIVGGVDLDMPVPLYDFTDVVAFGAHHSTVARTVEQAARSMGMTVSPDPMPEESIFVRSDHYQFVKQGVPAILLFTGYANGGKPHWDHFFKNVYHTPKDDLRQKILWPALAKYGKLNYRISRALADADARPLWYKGDYFGDAFAPGQPRAVR